MFEDFFDLLTSQHEEALEEKFGLLHLMVLNVKQIFHIKLDKNVEDSCAFSLF